MGPGQLSDVQDKMLLLLLPSAVCPYFSRGGKVYAGRFLSCLGDIYFTSLFLKSLFVFAVSRTANSQTERFMISKARNALKRRI